jgi:hypothetical protein
MEKALNRKTDPPRLKLRRDKDAEIDEAKPRGGNRG